jgi:hypothetical protein
MRHGTGPNGMHSIIVWKISGNGMTPTRLGEDDAEIISQLSVVKLTNKRLAISAITAAGNLKVIVWDVCNDGGVLVRQADAEAGGISRLNTVALSQTRLLTAVRSKAKTLKLIIWRVLPEGVQVQSNDETVPGDISDLSVAWIRNISKYDIRVATSAIAANGQLRIRYWKINSLN